MNKFERRRAKLEKRKDRRERNLRRKTYGIKDRVGIGDLYFFDHVSYEGVVWVSSKNDTYGEIIDPDRFHELVLSNKYKILNLETRVLYANLDELLIERLIVRLAKLK